MRKTGLLLALLTFAACKSTQKTVEPEEATVWEYLQAKYDTDGDGVIVVADYDRGEASFKRLDRDGDGQVTAEDFRTGGRMHVFVTQMTIARHFQNDEEFAVLTIEEVRAVFARADQDGDGVLELVEFEALVASTVVPEGTPAPRAMPPGMNAYDSMLRTMDRDDSGTVSIAEFEVFFETRDDDKDGKWVRRKRSRRTVQASGVAEGSNAPDFALRPPDGGEIVRLSSLRGRPVALIFGSYT